MIKLVENRDELGLDLRDVVVNTLQSMMDENESVLALEADLGGASHFTKIRSSHPAQFLECGISEANMMGVAAGASSEGFIPFCHTFGPFATRRAFDQVFLSGAYAKNTINIWGSDPGFCVGGNGGTHTTFEDVALMRTIPGAVVVDAADETQLAWTIREFAKTEGIHYVRSNRKPVRNVYDSESTFEIGKGNVLTEGSDVLIITAGQLVSDALDAAELLEKDGLSVEVIDMFCIKPLDRELVIKEAQGKKCVVTFENHGVIGGLGSAVAEVLAEEGIAVPFKRHGVVEQFGQVGTPAFLQSEFKLTSTDLVETVTNLIK